MPLLIEAGARVDGLVEVSRGCGRHAESCEIERAALFLFLQKRLLSVWHAVVSGNIDVVNMIIESGAVTRDGCHNLVSLGVSLLAEALP